MSVRRIRTCAIRWKQQRKSKIFIVNKGRKERTSFSSLKNFSLCPYCYNNPPFNDMRKNVGCNECTHPTCSYSLAFNSICACYVCNQGIFLLDVTAIPKYRLACNKYVGSICFSLFIDFFYCSGVLLFWLYLMQFRKLFLNRMNFVHNAKQR